MLASFSRASPGASVCSLHAFHRRLSASPAVLHAHVQAHAPSLPPIPFPSLPSSSRLGLVPRPGSLLVRSIRTRARPPSRRPSPARATAPAKEVDKVNAPRSLSDARRPREPEQHPLHEHDSPSTGPPTPRRQIRQVQLEASTEPMKTISSVTSFSQIGIHPNLATLLTQRLPYIRAPTPTQTVLIPSMMSRPRSDLILRAQTGNGKSFGVLLALLSQPRLKLTTTLGVRDASQPSVLTKPAISALVIVPSNDLAFQYRDWARHVLPDPEGPFDQLDPILQILVRKDPARSDRDQLKALRESPPHVLVATPTRLREILDDPNLPGGGGRSLLGLRTLRALVLDEVDALFQLPGRYPTPQQAKQMELHPAPGLSVMNEIMRLRPTLSGTTGRTGEVRHEGPRSHGKSRKKPHLTSKTASRNRWTAAYAAPLPRGAVDQKGVPIPPLQLIAISATANSVLRHFLGARTGWLKIGAREHGRFTGQWVDLTGQSLLRFDAGNRTDISHGKDRLETSVQLALEGGSIPEEIEHYCLVVDHVVDDRTANVQSTDPDQTPLPGLRNMYVRPAKPVSDSSELYELSPSDANARQVPLSDEFTEKEESIPPSVPHGSSQGATTLEQYRRPKAVAAYVPSERGLDFDLVETAAFLYSSLPTGVSAVIIPGNWSQQKVVEHLKSLGLPAQAHTHWMPTSRDAVSTVVDQNQRRAGTEDKESNFFVLTADQVRGIHIPNLTQVFILTTDAIKSAPHYLHLAGRVARLQTANSTAQPEIDPQAGQAASPSTSSSPPAAAAPVTFGRPNGQVFTIVRGVPAGATGWSDAERPGPPLPGDPTVVSSEETRMGSILAGVGVQPKVFPLTMEQNSPSDNEQDPASSAQEAPLSPGYSPSSRFAEQGGSVDEGEEEFVETYRPWEEERPLHVSEEAAEEAAMQAHLQTRRLAQAELKAELAGLASSERDLDQPPGSPNSDTPGAVDTGSSERSTEIQPPTFVEPELEVGSERDQSDFTQASERR